MKITEKRLKEIIKQELKEFTTTSGGTAATQRVKSAEKDTAAKISAKKVTKNRNSLK